METSLLLLTSLNEIKSKSSKYITVEMEDNVKNALTEISELEIKLTEEEQKCMAEMKKIIVKGKLTADNRKKAINCIDVLKGIDKKCLESKKNQPMTKKIKVDELEDKLDGEISCYSKYDDCNPMKGVSWNDSKKRYIVSFENEDGEKKSLSFKEDSLLSACEKMKENLIQELSGLTISLVGENNIKKFPFSYRNHDFITYWYNGHFYFDIRHVIDVLELKQRQTSEKYSEYEEQISHIYFFENEHGGFIPRELILNEVAYDIILNSTSKFAKSFKKDIAKFLAKLQDTNNLILSNNELVLRKEKPLEQATEIDCYKYTNVSQYNEIFALIRKGTEKCIIPYLDEPAMYLFIVDLPTKNHEIIIKPGYTADITGRMKSLKSEYDCNVFFMDVRFVKSERDEKRFHEALKTKHPGLEYSTVINEIEKTELYYFHPSILEAYYSFMPEMNNKVPVSKKELTHDEKELIAMFQNQNAIFVNGILNRLIKTETSMVDYLKLQSQLEYSYRELKLRLDNQKDIRLAELEADVKKMELQVQVETERLKLESKKVDLEIIKASQSKKK